MTWKPTYYELDLFSDCMTAKGEPCAAPERVRYASPYEWGEVIDIDMAHSPEYRLGLVTRLSARLGDGWVLVVPETDETYLVDETGSTGGVAKCLLWVRLTDLTLALELRTKARTRPGV